MMFSLTSPLRVCPSFAVSNRLILVNILPSCHRRCLQTDFSDYKLGRRQPDQAGSKQPIMEVMIRFPTKLKCKVCRLAMAANSVWTTTRNHRKRRLINCFETIDMLTTTKLEKLDQYLKVSSISFLRFTPRIRALIQAVLAIFSHMIRLTSTRGLKSPAWLIECSRSFKRILVI